MKFLRVRSIILSWKRSYFHEITIKIYPRIGQIRTEVTFFSVYASGRQQYRKCCPMPHTLSTLSQFILYNGQKFIPSHPKVSHWVCIGFGGFPLSYYYRSTKSLNIWHKKFSKLLDKHSAKLALQRITEDEYIYKTADIALY